jgi:uncharacterized protein
MKSRIDAEVINSHVHFDYKADMDAFVKTARKLSMAFAVSACGPMFVHHDNDAVAEAIRKYPDTVIGMAYIGLGRGDTPQTVERAHDAGFTGLKCIVPIKDYDNEEYFPIYAKAEELRMPILFHTGVIARSDVWLEEARKAGRPVPPHPDPRTFNISSRRMEPMCVDGIARAFPDLNCIMAHFGSTGRRDISEGIIRWNPNIYGDLSSKYSGAYEVDDSPQGWHIEPKFVAMFVEDLRQVHVSRLTSKLLYGTDAEVSGPQWLAAQLASQKAIYNALGLDEKAQRAILHDTAARLLNLQ